MTRSTAPPPPPKGVGRGPWGSGTYTPPFTLGFGVRFPVSRKAKSNCLLFKWPVTVLQSRTRRSPYVVVTFNKLLVRWLAPAAGTYDKVHSREDKSRLMEVMRVLVCIIHAFPRWGEAIPTKNIPFCAPI